jgi:hypothetical protein
VFRKPDGRHQLQDDDLAIAQTVLEMARHGRRRHHESRGSDRSRWHWLLAIPVVVPLLTPLYNRLEPRLFGLPFFYWCQLAFVGLAVSVTTVVHQATKKRGRP